MEYFILYIWNNDGWIKEKTFNSVYQYEKEQLYKIYLSWKKYIGY